jgi:hypothetical protein
MTTFMVNMEVPAFIGMTTFMVNKEVPAPDLSPCRTNIIIGIDNQFII